MVYVAVIYAAAEKLLMTSESSVCDVETTPISIRSANIVTFVRVGDEMLPTDGSGCTGKTFAEAD